MKIKIGDIDISIDLRSGIYTTYPESGVGKTYLYSLINAANNEGQKVLAITYNDAKNGLDNVISKVSECNWKFIIVDRYDLYEDSRLTEVLAGAGCPVLLDIKCTGIKSFGCNECVLSIEKNRIQLYEDDI